MMISQYALEHTFPGPIYFLQRRGRLWDLRHGGLLHIYRYNLNRFLLGLPLQRPLGPRCHRLGRSRGSAKGLDDFGRQNVLDLPLQLLAGNDTIPERI